MSRACCFEIKIQINIVIITFVCIPISFTNYIFTRGIFEEVEGKKRGSIMLNFKFSSQFDVMTSQIFLNDFLLVSP